MENSKKEIKVVMNNIADFIEFGIRTYRSGVCDTPVKKQYKLVDETEMYGYTKKEVSKMLGISVRQLDRDIKSGKLPKGRKIRGMNTLYFDKTDIDAIIRKNRP